MEGLFTLRPSTERRPLRMHSLRPVPRTTTSYSSSMAMELQMNSRVQGEMDVMREWKGDCKRKAHK